VEIIRWLNNKLGCAGLNIEDNEFERVNAGQELQNRRDIARLSD